MKATFEQIKTDIKNGYQYMQYNFTYNGWIGEATLETKTGWVVVYLLDPHGEYEMVSKVATFVVEGWNYAFWENWVNHNLYYNTLPIQKGEY